MSPNGVNNTIIQINLDKTNKSDNNSKLFRRLIWTSCPVFFRVFICNISIKSRFIGGSNF